ncbi:MAG: tetratricopeptide repeat protein [Deltaproteobacteria bacterium]|nr:tetratricopeptide repeat protein [Deltaproteobacteria bacterium]
MDKAPEGGASERPGQGPMSLSGDLPAGSNGMTLVAGPPLSPEERAAQNEKAQSLSMTGDFEAPVTRANLPPLLDAGAPKDGPYFPAAPAEQAARIEAMIQDYEREIAALSNDPRAAPLLIEVGRLYEEYLGRPRNAATSYERAFNLDPRDPSVLHASRRLFTEVGKWNMVVQILGFEIEFAETAERKAALHAEKGTILEEKLRNADEAQKAFRQALEVWSAEPLAINALERLHLYRREYDLLEQVYDRALAVTSNPARRLPLLLASAQLAEDRLADLDRAVRRYQEILHADPKHGVALDALRRLLLALERWADFVEVLGISAAQSEVPTEAAAYLLTAARIQSEKLGQIDRALLSLLQALEHAPEDLAILKEIELLYEQNDRYDEVVKVLRREAEVTVEPRDRVPILHKLGSILEDKLQLIEDAVPVFEEAVGLMPNYVPAKQALGRLYEKTGRWSSLADLFEMEIRLEEDPTSRVGRLLKLAEIRETKLSQETEAIVALKELLAAKPDYQPGRKSLERLLLKREQWADLIALYDQELSFTEDRDQQIFLLNRIGLYAEEKLNALDVAAHAFERVLDLVPRHLHAIRTLSRIATKREAWPDVLRLSELEVEATEDQKEVVAILHRAGQVIEEKLGDRVAAMSQYEKVLTLNPTYLPALRSLGKLYHQQERWGELLSMYQREAEVAKSAEQKTALLFRSADVLQTQVKDDQRAAQIFEQILQLDSSNLPALRALAEIHGKTAQSEALVDVLSREAAILKDPKERAATLMRVAEISETKLDRADKAVEVYQEILRLGFHFDQAIRALVRIYAAEGLWNALGRALRSAFDHAQDDATRASILIRSAEVAGEKLGNLDAAAENLEQALILQPSSGLVLSQLERISVARRDWRRAISVSQELVKYETDPRLYAARQIRIALMKETQIDPPESGAEHYRLALETVPDHPVALRALELAYLRAHHWEALAHFYHREALVSTGDAKRASLFLRSADYFESRLGQDPAASELYQRALEVMPTSLPALRGRRRTAERLGQAQIALDCLDREAKLTADPSHGVELRFDAGRLYQDQFKDRDRAVQAYEGVLDQQPAHALAFSRLETIFMGEAAYRPLLDLYVRRARAVPDQDEQATLYVSAGQMAQDRLQEPGTAIELYRQVLQRNRMHAMALVRLGPLLFAAGEWDEAIDVFHRTLAVSKESTVLLTTFKSLGIIYQEHRQDLVKCVQSFQAALQADPTNTECLRRLASVYKGAADWYSAINVLLRLAEVETQPRAKIVTLLDLASVYEHGAKDRGNAIRANKKVLELEPTNQEAILRLTDLHEQEQDWNALAEVTGAYVRLLPADQKTKAAPLHLKMADVFETKLHDDKRAANALGYALELQPDNAQAIERLARLYAKNAESLPQAIDMHRRLLRIDPFRVDSLHEMHRMYERLRQHDKAFVIAELLVYLRAQQQDEYTYYYEHKSKVAPSASGELSRGDHERWVTHPMERGPIRDVLEVVGPELARWQPIDPAKYDVAKADRHGPKSVLPIRKLADELAQVLGVPPYELWVTKKFEVGFAIENEKPTALVVGSNVARRVQEKDQRFLLGRQLERIKGGHHLLDQIPAREMEAIFWCLAKIGLPSGSVPIDPAAMDATMARLNKALSSKTRRVVEEIGKNLFNTHVEVTRHRTGAAHTANRAGLIMTNDLEVVLRNIAQEQGVKPVFMDTKGAIETIGKVAEVRELMSYAISEEYFAARAKLGFSIQA